MSTQLFEDVFLRAQTRYTSPGDLVRNRSKATNRQSTGGKRRAEPKEKYKPNPFRQPIADRWETEYRHGNWEQDRARRRAAMKAAGTSTAPLDRWDNCGAECLVEWSDEAQRYRLKASYCHCRHCEPCARSRAGLIQNNLKTHLVEAQKARPQLFKFLCFTLKHNTQPLRSQITRLYACFRKLRQSKIWKATQRGGAAMLEVKLTEHGAWHPHLHIVGEGDFLSKERLCREWEKVTGDSYIADIKVIKTAKDAAFYVTKYVTKGTTSNVWSDPAKAQEYVEAMKGVRVCATYGTWRGFKLLQIDAANTVKDWKPVALLTTIIEKADRGDVVALDMLVWLTDSLRYDPHKKRQSKKTETQ